MSHLVSKDIPEVKTRLLAYLSSRVLDDSPDRYKRYWLLSFALSSQAGGDAAELALQDRIGIQALVDAGLVIITPKDDSTLKTLFSAELTDEGKHQAAMLALELMNAQGESKQDLAQFFTSGIIDQTVQINPAEVPAGALVTIQVWPLRRVGGLTAAFTHEVYTCDGRCEYSLGRGQRPMEWRIKNFCWIRYSKDEAQQDLADSDGAIYNADDWRWLPDNSVKPVPPEHYKASERPQTAVDKLKVWWCKNACERCQHHSAASKLTLLDLSKHVYNLPESQALDAEFEAI